MEQNKSQKMFSEYLKKEFEGNNHMVVHWDGKLLEDITWNEIVDRLPVKISGGGQDQLLGVPKLDHSKGQDIANAVHQLIIYWDLVTNIKGMCFDTTVANTGRKSGACVILEQKMEKDLLWFPCRHHIAEIILEAVVSPVIQISLGPDIQLFKRFKSQWKEFNKTSYHVLEEYPKEDKERIINFASRKLKEDLPRNDYRELLEITIILLGGTPTKGFIFRKPGAYHRARWIAKVIYTLKIFMFNG